MANITLVRVDHRLIHGQVITKWVKIAQASKILIIDDYLGQDEFMADIYRMSAPSGIEVQILTAEQAAKSYQEDDLGTGKIFVLFKNLEMAYKTYQLGLHYSMIQLGGIPNDGKKKMIFTAVSLDEDDIEKLKDIHESGVNVVLQIVPEEASMSYEVALKKFNS